MSAEKIHPEEYFKSLNGFEELAIERMFHRSTGELAMRAEQGDVFGLMRSLLFVEARRAGVKDGQAYRDVMNLSAVDVAEQFEPEGSTPDAEGKDQEPTSTTPTPGSWFGPVFPSPSSNT